ncbi:hypothetical protein GCM10010326_58400 [Streptomyces xanthochromogenes]|uniref:Uncharacterized protein n=1 Tax=Streptomyces xanthochromogenes TaxID=67384 RepID=A0ABQ3AJH4_9ACTN|nr:hypothetical protein GCM10010326_58400 [Streptomyces xanthochromogenes]
MREEQQQDAGAERHGRREGAEGARKHFADRVEPTVPDAIEDSGRDVQEAHDRAGRTDQLGNRLGARPAEDLSYTSRNRSVFVPIYPDRHRFP